MENEENGEIEYSMQCIERIVKIRSLQFSEFN